MNDPNEHLLRAALVALFARDLGTISSNEAFGVAMLIEQHLADQGGHSLAWVQSFHELRMMVDRGDSTEASWRHWVVEQLLPRH